MEDSRRFQYFRRDADELESWINEKLQTASDESYKDPTNLQAKIQKHQAFEAEVAAHSNAIVVLDNTGMEMINRVPERHGVSAEAAEAGIKMLEDFLKSMDRVRRKVAPAAAKKPAAKKPTAKKGEIHLPSSDCPPGWQRSKSRRGNSKT